MVSYSVQTGAKQVKSKAKLMLSLGLVSAVALAAAVTLNAQAASQVIVTPTDTQGWTTADTRPGGAATIVADATAPGNPHNGALQLTTDATTTSKAQYMHEANVALSAVTELKYATKQNTAAFPDAAASYQLPVCLQGLTATPTVDNPTGCNGFTTLVYEPYENGTVTAGVWQHWDAAAGKFWSSKTAGTGDCSVQAGFGGAPFYTLAQLQSVCPAAAVVGFGVNIGSNNPSYDVEADLVNFNGTVYNFEPFVTPAPPTVATDKDQCKNDGWKTVVAADGKSFKNQGDCVSYVATKGKNPAKG